MVAPLPPLPNYILDQESLSGWVHPTNQFQVPYIVNLNEVGKPYLLWHPGPNLERPTIRWTNIIAKGSYSIEIKNIPDNQGIANQIALIRDGSVIGTSINNVAFTTTLTLNRLDWIEVTLSGNSYLSGGDYVKFTITGPTGTVYDSYADFITNKGAPTSMWQYFYRSNVGYPLGAINSAGPMVPA